MRLNVESRSRRRTWLVGALVLAALALALRVGLRWGRVGDPPPLGPSARTIAPGIHLLGGLSPSAAYAVETSEGLVLIDSGLEPDAGPLKAQLVELGLDWRRVRVVLLTHAHGDHCGGAEYLRSAAGAKVYAGRGDAPVLRAGGPRDAVFSIFSMPNHSPHPTNVDVELDGGESLTFGDVTFRALATPGHTPGSTCYLLERSGLRALFAGDVISMLRGDENPHVRGRRPLGTYSAYLAPRYRGDASAYLASLRALRALPVPDLVLPGHPRSDPSPQIPRLSQRRWEAMLDRGIGEMETLLARYRADGADFLDGQPKRLLPDLYYLGDFRGSAVYGLSASSKFFLVNAPGGPGLTGFLQAGLRRLGLDAEEPTAVLLTSCDPEATAGLKELVEAFHPQVVADPEGLRTVRALCPPDTTFVSSEDLSGKGWFEVTTIPLRGRGLAPVAYLVPRAGKSALFTPRMPIMFDHDALESLSSDLARSREIAIEYLTSINHLEGLKPDLWLPSVPSEGQNANLYRDEWKSIIANNYRAGYFVLQRLR